MPQSWLHVHISLRSQRGGYPALRPSTSWCWRQRSGYRSPRRVLARFLRSGAMGQPNGRPPRKSNTRGDAESSEGIALAMLRRWKPQLPDSPVTRLRGGVICRTQLYLYRKSSEGNMRKYVSILPDEILLRRPRNPLDRCYRLFHEPPSLHAICGFF